MLLIDQKQPYYGSGVTQFNLTKNTVETMFAINITSTFAKT